MVKSGLTRRNLYRLLSGLGSWQPGRGSRRLMARIIVEWLGSWTSRWHVKRFASRIYYRLHGWRYVRLSCWLIGRQPSRF